MIAPQAAVHELRASGRRGWPRPVRLVRGAGLHARPPPRGRDGGRRALLHGAPPGHDGGRARQRAARRRHADPLSRRADGPGHRAPAAGTHDARRGRRPSATRRGAGGRPCPRTRAADAAPLPVASSARRPDATALQRPVRRDDDRGGVGIQPLGRSRGDPLARRRRRATAGARTSSFATPTAAPCGRRATSPAASSPIGTRRRSSRTASTSSGATARSRPGWR